nr:uncharacterized protein LOC119168265 [Rhipicephalus microplus]
MPSCFAPGCTSGYRNDAANHHFFTPPRKATEFKQWEHMLHHKDRRLTQKSKVCERHFEEQDIVKYFKHVVKGQEVLIPRGNWKLVPGALPRLFPGLPEHISKPGKTKCTRKSPKKRNEIGLEASAESASCSSGSCGEASLSLGDSLGAVGITPPPSTSATNSSGVCLNELVTVPLPSRDWKLELIVDECSGQTCGVFFDRRLVAGELKVSKAVIVKNDGSCVVNGYNKMHKQLHKTVDSTASVEHLLNETDSLKICSGIQVAHTGVTGKLENVHHKLCSVLTTRPVCVRCLRLQRQMRARKPMKAAVNKSKKMGNLTKKVFRAAAAREKGKQEITLLKQELAKASYQGIEEALSGLPHLQRLAFLTALKSLKAKAPCGMRYNSEWILNCLMLRISSPRAYKLISEMKMLPLPSLSRLAQILKGLPCKYGFNPVCLEAIQKQFHGKADEQRLGSLILDEIKLRQAYDFNKCSYKMDGFVDYGGVTNEGTNQLADHALVLMFVPLFESWVQLIAAFATKGAAPGKILAELVLEAVVRLHKHNATVISIVSDGAGNNRSMWQQLGVSGSMAAPCHKIAHPFLPDGKFVHFICDVPHAIKCVRNHLLKHKYGQAGENRIDFSHYQLLYETEKKKHLKVAHKLTEAHVQPTNFQKMNVRLAVRVIKDFLVMLDTTEFNHNTKNTLLFASRQTTESLRVTLLSIIDIIDELHKAGVPYVLTAKLNQDPLERFFGIVRSFHGDDDHPTIIQFSQIYRLLSLFTPVRNAAKGNCPGPAEGVLVSIHESLAEKAKAAAELKLAVEAKLDKKLLGMEPWFEWLKRKPLSVATKSLLSLSLAPLRYTMLPDQAGRSCFRKESVVKPQKVPFAQVCLKVPDMTAEEPLPTSSCHVYHDERDCYVTFSSKALTVIGNVVNRHFQNGLAVVDLNFDDYLGVCGERHRLFNALYNIVDVS